MALIPPRLFVERGIYWKSYPGFIWNLPLSVPFCQRDGSTRVTFRVKEGQKRSVGARPTRGKDGCQGSPSTSGVDSFYLFLFFSIKIAENHREQTPTLENLHSNYRKNTSKFPKL